MIDRLLVCPEAVPLHLLSASLQKISRSRNSGILDFNVIDGHLLAERDDRLTELAALEAGGAALLCQLKDRGFATSGATITRIFGSFVYGLLHRAIADKNIMSPDNRIAKSISLATAVGVTRISLGIVLLVGGWKLAFPANPEGLVQGYVNPDSGFIAPLLVEWIQQHLRFDVLDFLRMMGWLEMTVGLALVSGFATPWIATIAGLLFLSFPMANPAPGMIRLAQDVSMGGLAFAIAFTGSGRFSMDARLGWFQEAQPERRNWFLGLVRVGLLYALVMALLFPFGVGLNRLNQSLPWLVVLALTIALVPPRTARFACGAIAVWMAVLVVYSVAQALLDQGMPGLYWGLDAVKREFGLLGGSLAYAMVGPDTISLIPPGKSAHEDSSG